MCGERQLLCIVYLVVEEKILPLYRHFSDFKSHCGFSIAGAGYTIFPVSEGYFVSLIISTSNGSIFWVFYDD